MKMERKEKGAFINSKCAILKQERANQKAAVVEQRTKELETEIPKAITDCKKLGDLLACITDARLMLKFFLEYLGLKPKDVKLMTVKSVFE